ncbi:MAG TPA: hypothetical protein VKU91_00255 [Acidimicrobiales bacterium]|nr:hypothetical protein [Acidimicrobiales bacterium]
MALDDEDRSEIGQMIADAIRQVGRQPTRTSPGTSSPAPPEDWSRMSPRDQERWMREIVEEQIASIDAETERQQLRRENEALKKQVAEWEKAGRPGKRPTRQTVATAAAPEDPQPTVVSKAYRLLFGDPK